MFSLITVDGSMAHGVHDARQSHMHTRQQVPPDGNTPTILVTGGAGMVGSYACDVFADWNLITTDVAHGYRYLDVRDPKAVQSCVAMIRPTAVVHLAAATDVDRCEREPEWGFHLNALGTENVARACRQHDVPLVYISTAAVFPGDRAEPYAESDAPKPANAYGRSKLAGEDAVVKLLDRYYIVRAGWMFGGVDRDHKFVGKIARLITQATSPLKIVDDKIGSPTFGRDLLVAVRELLQTRNYGLFHAVNSGYATRLQIAHALRAALDRPDVAIMPVSSAEFALSAPRGCSEALSSQKLDRLAITMRPWQDALADYVATALGPWLQKSRVMSAVSLPV